MNTVKNVSQDKHYTYHGVHGMCSAYYSLQACVGPCIVWQWMIVPSFFFPVTAGHIFKQIKSSCFTFMKR